MFSRWSLSKKWPNAHTSAVSVMLPLSSGSRGFSRNCLIPWFSLWLRGTPASFLPVIFQRRRSQSVKGPGSHSDECGAGNECVGSECVSVVNIVLQVELVWDLCCKGVCQCVGLCWRGYFRMCLHVLVSDSVIDKYLTGICVDMWCFNRECP